LVACCPILASRAGSFPPDAWRDQVRGCFLDDRAVLKLVWLGRLCCRAAVVVLVAWPAA
jgi:hypothetical protein